ncbi:MAG: vWA domain-containing protein [Acidimicrobiales bacterium]
MADTELDHAGPTRSVVTFCRALRTEGLSVAVPDVFTYVHALGILGVRRTGEVYWAGRATLVRRPEDVEVYDRVFSAFWSADESSTREPVAAIATKRIKVTHQDSGSTEGADRDRGSLRYSRAEVLRDKDFAGCSPEELAEAIETMRNLPLTEVVGPSRRWRSGRRGRRPDIRSTMRHSMRRGGEIVHLEQMRRVPRVRRLVLLCDVSGSMEPYARALLRFAHILVAGRTRVEAFALGTRLTRLTRQLSSRDPDAAMAAASAAVPDWSGGTRLGEGLREFNDRFGVVGIARGSQVVVLSDGWDRGDPEELGSQMSRLHRVARQIVWVNPLKASPGYQPLAQGMAAALPHIDRFVPGHNVASLRALLEVLAS